MGTAEDERSLHRYELVERIAVGGMAEVFRAKAYGAHGFEKALAIKRILPDLAMDPEFEDRFIAEAKLAVRLNHANIVQVFDFGRFGGSLFLAMEYVDGPDLAALLKVYGERGRDVPVGPALHVAMELAKGLDFAHRRSVVHRDVSPSNILLSRAGEVKIADFGIAQAAAESGGARSETRRIMGKWRYMSPEQARGERLHPRSDLFSAGAVLWELFTGRKLFVGDDAATIVRNVCEMPIPAATSVRPELPPGLDPILARLVERDLERRFGDAAELLRALLEVSYSRTLVATALDVADLVAWAFPPHEDARRPARAIDDIIQAELLRHAAASSVEQTSSRRTETGATPAPDPVDRDRPTTISIVARGEDGRGIPVFEVQGVDAFAKTLTQGVEAPDAGREREREPDGRADAPDAGPAAPASPVAKIASRIPIGVIAIGTSLIAAALAIVVIVSRGGDPTPAVVGIDAGVRAGEIEIETDPPGATIRFDGTARAEVTPTTIQVAASDTGRRHVVELELAGHRAWKDEAVVVGAGERVKLRAQLTKKLARLRVATEPAGAEVWIDDRSVGTTPLSDDAVPADGALHELRLRKKGYADLVIPISLEDDALISVERQLETAIKYGRIKLSVQPWAFVYFNGKKIAEAPTDTLILPVGRQRLKLENPELQVVKYVTCDVPPTGAAMCGPISLGHSPP